MLLLLKLRVYENLLPKSICQIPVHLPSSTAQALTFWCFALGFVKAILAILLARL